MRTRKKNNYWTKETDLKVLEYITTNDMDKRNEIFEHHLQIPLAKIAEVWTNKIVNYERREEVMKDALAHVMMIINKLNHDKLRKGEGFSYINTVVKHYCMNRNTKGYTSYTRNIDFDHRIDGGDVTIGDMLITEEKDAGTIWGPNYDFEGFRKRLIEYWDTKKINNLLNNKFKDENIISSYKRSICKGLKTLGSTKMPEKIKILRSGRNGDYKNSAFTEKSMQFLAKESENLI
jgi:hypothetical protein